MRDVQHAIVELLLANHNMLIFLHDSDNAAVFGRFGVVDVIRFWTVFGLGQRRSWVVLEFD